MCFASKRIRRDAYDKWKERWEAASTAIPDREANVAKAMEEMERGLTFLGVTAVVDELQDGVRETICALQDAKINVWILSGDRQENAVSTAR